MTAQKKVYITTSIPYVNARPHLGHALELVQSDAIARGYRHAGYDVTFQTGTDENAFKNALAAKALGISTVELVDTNAAAFRTLVDRLNVSADSFIRTTEERHRLGVAEFWKRLRPEDIDIRGYAGLYCVGCEDFYLEKDLVGGRCPDHGTAPALVKEANFFFRLSAYEAQLADLIRSDTIRIVPAKRKTEVLRFIEQGLQDISISRSAERSGGWGIPVPGDPSQVIYVWIDALINYISGQGFGVSDAWQQVWNSSTHKIHIIGKNVWKFHAIYWPALLISAGLPLTNEIFIHGFLTEGGAKISKSSGNAANPLDYADRFGVDGLRHFLLKATSPFEDGDISEQRVAAVYESDLANGIGNLVSRVTALCEKSGFHGQKELLAEHTDIPTVKTSLLEYRLDEAAQRIWEEVHRLNREIATIKPWEFLRDERISELHPLLDRWIDDLFRVAFALRPFLPETSERIVELLAARPVQRATALFPRLQYKD